MKKLCVFIRSIEYYFTAKLYAFVARIYMMKASKLRNSCKNINKAERCLIKSSACYDEAIRLLKSISG